MMRRRRVKISGFLVFLLMLSFSCKKSPVTPSPDDLLRPVIWLSSFEFSFTAYESGGNPEAQALRIKNSGKNTLQYSFSDDADWLSVEPGSGSSSGQLVEHALLINKAGLTAREEDYKATVTVISSEAYNNPQRVSVSLNISVEPPLPTDNRISIACSPASGTTGKRVSVPISIRGNLQSINTYGLEFTFDSNLFQYQGTSKGTLTASWAVVDGNLSAPGALTVGGFAGSAKAIPAGSVGTIAVVTLRVTGAGYSDGHQSQVTIRAYGDDISGMRPDPFSTVFTYRQ
jgi:hypothetical protein